MNGKEDEVVGIRYESVPEGKKGGRGGKAGGVGRGGKIRGGGTRVEWREGELRKRKVNKNMIGPPTDFRCAQSNTIGLVVFADSVGIYSTHQHLKKRQSCCSAGQLKVWVISLAVSQASCDQC